VIAERIAQPDVDAVWLLDRVVREFSALGAQAIICFPAVSSIACGSLTIIARPDMKWTVDCPSLVHRKKIVFSQETNSVSVHHILMWRDRP
jgi:hypothetical protein